MKRCILYSVFWLSLGTAVYAGPAGWISRSVECGTQVEISAEPLNGYRFVRWSDGNSEPTRTVDVAGDATYTAVFEPSEPTALDEPTSGRVQLLPNTTTVSGQMLLTGLNPAEKTTVQIFNTSGQLIRKYTSFGEPHCWLQAEAVGGCYTVCVSSQTIKTTLRYIVYAR